MLKEDFVILQIYNSCFLTAEYKAETRCCYLMSLAYTQYPPPTEKDSVPD